MALIIALLVALIGVARGDWGGCVNPSEPDEDSSVVRGDPTTVCLTVGPGGDWNAVPGVSYKRFTFRPEADEFSVYKIPGSYDALVVENSQFQPNVTVFAASQTSLSFLRRYYDESTERIFPYLTAIIDVKDGEVVGIVWDDACVFCSSSRCTENTYNFAGEAQPDLDQSTEGCYFNKAECDEIKANGGNECELRLFVVWTGSDKDGNVLTSSNSRFSAFPPSRLQEQVKDSLPELSSPDWFSDLW